MHFEEQYLCGLGNEFATEALPGALPVGQNTPQSCAYGLYAEQLSGSAFTALPGENKRSWLYRLRPSVLHGRFKLIESLDLGCAQPVTPEQLRWDPLPYPSGKKTFWQSLIPYCVTGCHESQQGSAVYAYAATAPMKDDFFYDADGELLIVPQEGSLELRTEFGRIDVKPGEIAVIGRGMRFQALPLDGKARGYVCENYGAPFRLPYRGPIGANGLANARDFLTPRACFEDKEGKFRLVVKFQGTMWEAPLKHSPLDVVAWHGNYAPYKYDLALFNTMNTVSYDHPDPSIFTVLTSPSSTPGVANIDFVIFPPRWMVAEHTFRPPYFHRNIMSEFMGLIHGKYDAKEKGFLPGGASLHNIMSAHGPEADVFEKASKGALKPQKYENTLAFMFESRTVYKPTTVALKHKARQSDYIGCWQGLKKNFTGKP